MTDDKDSKNDLEKNELAGSDGGQASTRRRNNSRDRRANTSDRRDTTRISVGGERRQNSDDRRD